MNSLFAGRTIKLLPLLAALVSLSLSAYLRQTSAQSPKVETRSTSKWEWSDDGWKRRVEIHGNAEFTDDYSDVSNLSEGGFLAIEEFQQGESRRFEVRRDTAGQLVRRYFVGGEVRPLDEKARQWLAGLLLIAVRQGAIDVDKRVSSIIRQRGINGVLAEIAGISGDYAKGRYFQALLKKDNLSRADLQRALDAAGAQISSDYEKANILKNTADTFLDEPMLRGSFFQTVATVHSDYERRGVLSALIKRKNLSGEVLAHLLEAASGISSDYEKATFLLQASNLYTADANLRSAFLKTVETIKSDHERGRVLSALLRRKQIG